MTNNNGRFENVLLELRKELPHEARTGVPIRIRVVRFWAGRLMAKTWACAALNGGSIPSRPANYTRGGERCEILSRT